MIVPMDRDGMRVESAVEIPQHIWEQQMNLRFPEDKRDIAGLSYESKLDWYQYQFNRVPGVLPVELTTAEFARFWKWQVLVPMKFKRFYYRVKNLEVFKRYPHITEIRKKVKPHSI